MLFYCIFIRKREPRCTLARRDGDCVEKCSRGRRARGADSVHSTLLLAFVGGGDVVEPVTDLLSEIINQVNNTYGINLTDDDKVDIERLRDRLVTDPEIIKYMNGQNTEDNKKNFFKEQFDEMMVDYVNERFEFYKKMDDNPSMKNLIFKMMYDDYQNSRNGLGI